MGEDAVEEGGVIVDPLFHHVGRQAYKLVAEPVMGDEVSDVPFKLGCGSVVAHYENVCGGIFPYFGRFYQFIIEQVFLDLVAVFAAFVLKKDGPFAAAKRTQGLAVERTGLGSAFKIGLGFACQHTVSKRTVAEFFKGVLVVGNTF